jgi:alpha-glucuronidase
MTLRRFSLALRIALCATMLLAGRPLRAESPLDGWLTYARLSEPEAAKYRSLPAVVVVAGRSPVQQSAQQEVIRGVRGMLGRTLRAESSLPAEPAIVLGTAQELRARGLQRQTPPLAPDGFWLAHEQVHGIACIVVAGSNERGVLYGAFALLRAIAQGQALDGLNEVQQPSAPIRWVNQWDNLDGSIERGYGGRSIFFNNGEVRRDLTRAATYARLLASVGVNGCTVNNVNADLRVLDPAFLPQLERIADAFRPWGVRLSIAVDLSSPKRLGGLNTFDPLDPRVAAWWRDKVNEIYRRIPDFGGFVVKADSEGRLGPSAYGRTHADAANVLARALKPHGGLLFYRAFVYNSHLDWRDPKADRAKAAYDNFHPLDGKFDDNVVIQIKNGPIDFQVREPVSPLFAGLEKTNQAIELQITQEYTGQQRHLCFLAPMWKEALDFDLRVHGGHTPVKDMVAGRTFHRPYGGFVGVANVGLDANWLGSVLAMANLYGFGRLAWNPDLSAADIAAEWTRLTFGNEPLVVETVTRMLLASWRIYEQYTGPLGAGTLTNILGSHYGPAPESSERNGWGQWHRADHEGIGMDRTVATGTGYIGQYPPAVRRLYEALASCPDNLLLFFHHVPYTYVLHSGQTVIQYIYDSQYQGAEHAQEYVSEWKQLKGGVDDERYREVLAQLEYQAGHAIVWRDAICDWFHRLSGIPDEKGRVGRHPGRVEAEAMRLEGYAPVEVTPWEGASGGKAVVCPLPAQRCQASYRFNRAPGWYELDVEYFDQNNGVSHFKVYVGEQPVGDWTADRHLPADKPNADSSTRMRIPGLALRPGDLIRIVGTPDGGERAAFDYIELRPVQP